MATLSSADIEGMRFKRIGYVWRAPQDWLDRMTIFAGLVRMAWRVSLQAVVARRMSPCGAGRTGETMALTVSTGPVDGGIEPLYTVRPWAMEMTLTRDALETTHRLDKRREWVSLPTGRSIMIAVGDIRDVERVRRGA